MWQTPQAWTCTTRLAGTGVGDDDRLDGDRGAGGPGDDGACLVGHRGLLADGGSGEATLPARRLAPRPPVRAAERSPGQVRRPRVERMKKLLVLIVVVALAAFAVKKLQDA